MVDLLLEKKGSTLPCKHYCLPDGLLMTTPKPGMVAVWEPDGKLLFISSCSTGFSDSKDSDNLVAALKDEMYQEVPDLAGEAD